MSVAGLLLSDDLIFASRVVGTGSDLAIPFRTAKTPEALLSLARAHAPACVIVDLANPGLKIAEFVTALKQLTPPPTIVAYGSHVDTATLKAARDARCDRVMPRSQFVEVLPHSLAEWVKPKA